MDTSIVDKIITGRVQPHIYAFRTGTIPDYLKVGDTYRPVEVRLEEWRTHYESLVEVYRDKASVSDDVFFRDYAVHQYFREVLKLYQLQKKDLAQGIYYSDEFYRGATKQNVESAVEDIRTDFNNKGHHYHYYRFEDSRIPYEEHYPRNEKPFDPRKEQADTVANFLKAKEQGRTNLLMYAVMRFGKSFTAMLCAQAMDAKLVIVLCGKTAVKDEWQRNVEIPQNFEGYSFKTKEDLERNHNLISAAKENGEKIVLFLTLQDLSGDDIKERHRELFGSDIDLLIVDETHFGARAPEYGKVIQQEFSVSSSTGKNEAKDEDDIHDVDTLVKQLQPKIKLHLSGTPYRILMGSEFAPEDVIAFYQFTDIVDAQEKWDRDNLNNPKAREWDNPYYGFPQMVRFAFNPNASARKLLKELRENGKTCALTALFKPISIQKDADNQYRIFEHEKEVLELLEVIDGNREDDELLGFLNYDKIKEGQMCRHLVCVLPFRASCDAFQALVESNRDRFKNLSQYEILNIAGHDCPSDLEKPEDVKRKIKTYEDQGVKTITLTVNKMLTGSTVEYWDTMLFFKDTSSPQDYDQAIFRIQNPYIKEMKDDQGDDIKFNMKPQTLLVDFDIDRLFRLQAQKSIAYNANVDVNGNAELEKRMRRELEISPVIVLNKDRLTKVIPNDIMEAISEYSKNRSVADEAKEIPVDMRLFDDPVIRAEIDRQGAISSKEGLSTKPYKGEEEDIDTGNDSGVNTHPEEEAHDKTKKEKDAPEDMFRKRFATYYSRILFFTFLTKDSVTNLDEVIAAIDNGDDNTRLARNLDLRKDILVHLRQVMDGVKLGALEFKIRNLNKLVRDDDVAPLERAKTAMRRFSRLSEAEITTPENIARDMVALLPADCTPDMRFLDIAAKQGEFAIALVERYGNEIKSDIWSLPTSGVAYEFTRKVYEFLEMPIEHIIDKYIALSLSAESETNYQELFDLLQDMRFDVIVGNPPYQDPRATERAGINKAFSSAIYPSFVEVSRSLRPKYITMITPSRWMTGTGQGISETWVSELVDSNHFMVIQDFYDSTECFKEVELKGGVSYFIYSDSYTGKCRYVLHQAGKVYESTVNLNALGTGIVVRDPKALAIIGRIKAVEGNYYEEGRSFANLVGPQHFFDKDGKLTTRWKGYKLRKSKAYKIKYYLNRQVEPQGYAWIKESDIPKNAEIVPLHKVYLSKAFNGGDAIPHQIIGHAFYGEPGSLCSQTYLVIAWNQQEKQYSEAECKNMITYMNTLFFRYLVFIKKKTQDNPTGVFKYVPMQDYSKPWTDKELFEKYNLQPDEIDFIKATIKPME